MVKPIVKPLIEGESGVYTVAMQEILAQWLALKLFVFETAPRLGNPGTPIFGQKTRADFMKDRKVPPGFAMWLAPAGGPKWREGTQLQTSGALRSLRKLSSVDLDKLAPVEGNVQTMTWGIGQIVFSIVGVSDPSLYRVQWPAPPGHTQVWPTLGSAFVSPPNFSMTDWAIDRIAARHRLRLGESLPMTERSADGP